MARIDTPSANSKQLSVVFARKVSLKTWLWIDGKKCFEKGLCPVSDERQQRDTRVPYNRWRVGQFNHFVSKWFDELYRGGDVGM